MLFNLIKTELLKYKRTIVPWLSIVGGFFPVFVALLFLLASHIAVTWEGLASTALSYMNMLALLFIAVLTGQSFTSEYRGSRINMTFTYPVPRLTLYAVKLITLLLPVIGMYLVFLSSVALSGRIFAGSLPRSGFASGYLLLLVLSAAANFSIVPVTAVVSIAAKNAGAAVLAGIGYFVILMSFAGSDASRYVPPCVPDRLLRNYIAAGSLASPDTGRMMLVCAALFLIAASLGAACYAKWEI